MGCWGAPYFGLGEGIGVGLDADLGLGPYFELGYGVGEGLDADLALGLSLGLGLGFIFVFVLVLNPADHREDKNKFIPGRAVHHRWAAEAPHTLG